MPKRRPDHVPLRTCAVCRTAHPKREMARLVRLSDGSVQRDPTGKVAGRGTYVCNASDCQDPARIAAAVKRALGAEPRAREDLEVTAHASA